MKKIRYKLIAAAAATAAGILPAVGNAPNVLLEEHTVTATQTASIAAASSAPIFSAPLPTSKIMDYAGGSSRPRVDDGLSTRLLEQQDKNLVIRKKYILPASSAPTGAGSTSYNATVTYYDGLGYVDQKIEAQGSPIYSDVITPYKRDYLGHEDAWEYVPYTEATSTNGVYRENAPSAAERWHEDATYENRPYTYREYERSAEGRVLSRNLPGSSASIAQKYQYGTSSSAADKVLSIAPGSAAGSVTVAAAYKSDGSLFKATVTDEDGRTAIVFTDGTGKKILDRKLGLDAGGGTVFVDTYYVYDTFDRLVCVIQPEGSKLLAKGSAHNINSSNALRAYAYHYMYDSKGRLAGKMLPAAGWEYFVYDRNDRLVMRQDGNMRQSSVHRWLMYRYDSFGRLTSENMVSDAKAAAGSSFYSRSDWQQRFDNGQTSLPSGVVSKTTIAKEYNEALLTVRDPYRTVNIRKDALLAVNAVSDEIVWRELVTLDPQRIFFDEKGIIREEYWLGDVGKNFGERPRRYYYVPVELNQQILEICGRIAPTSWGMVTNLTFISQLKLPACISGKLDLYRDSGYIYNSNKLAFRPVNGVVALDDVDPRNKGLKTSERLAYIDKTGVTDKFLTRNFYYDSKGRIVQIVEDNGSDGFTRYSMKYDYTGNVLIYKEEHYTNSGTAAHVKQIDCVYDHRGRLMTETTALDEEKVYVNFNYDELGRMVSKRILGTDLKELTQIYRYNIRGHLTETGSPYKFMEYIGSTVKGEIRRIFTEVLDEPQMQTDLAYDALGRLDYAKTQHPVGPSETFVSYDANGNIMRLRQQTQLSRYPTPTGRTQTYTYAGNSVMKMQKDFDVPPQKSGICNFSYDYNGNMTYNGNKSLQLKYNYLNLLSEAVKADGSGVQYTWLADGTKTAATPLTPASGNSFAYRGSLEYNLSKSQVVTTFSGGILLEKVASTSTVTSVIHIKDHIGSVRLAVAGSKGVHNEYEPFGERDKLRSENAGWDAISADIPNQRLFNGKELQTTAQTGMLDYGARMYDPEMARWMSPDPKAEKYYSYSPYSFCLNNPMLYVDPDGKDIYRFDHKTGQMTLYRQTNDDFDQIGNFRMDRKTGEYVLRTDSKGNPRTIIDNIEKGILHDGINFKEQDNVIEVGAEGQASVEGFQKFITQFSDLVDREIGGYYANTIGNEAISHIQVGKYKYNSPMQAKAPLKIYNVRPDLYGKININTNFHTHLSKFDESMKLVPSEPDRNFKSRNNESGTIDFIILTTGYEPIHY